MGDMANFNVVYWFLAVVLLASIQIESSAVYIFDNSSPQKVSFLNRVRRQTHPAATIAKLTSHDSSAFIPIVGPTQTQSSQQHSSFSSSNDFFPGNDFPSLQNVPNTLVDYLVPPSPDSPTTTLNFQDPAANLHNLQNNLDNFEITSSPTPSPSTNSNNFPHFHSSFQGASNFQSHINNLQHLQTTPSTFINEQVQSVAFQNPSSAPSATPGLTQPTSSSSPSLGGIGQTFSNKISNTGTLNRDGFTPINNNGNHFHTSQFSITTSAPSLPSLTKTDHEKAHQSPSAGKWELGFDANEILTPPREDSFGRVGEYDTINVNKFRRPSTNLNPPVANGDVQSNQNHLSSNQFLGSQNGIHHQFNQFSGSTSGSSHNDVFTPVTGSHNHFTSNKENTIEQGNVIWGSQKQPVSYNPTTSAPFLPTIPPSTPSSLHLSNFQNLNQPPSVSQNFHGNSFNSAPQQLQQLQFTQPPPPPREQYFEFGQNFPIETPLTSQFDTFLPQGTVADHTYQPYNENGRHFVKKRHWNGEDRPAELTSRKKSPNSGNLAEKYGKVVLSQDPKLFVQTAKVNRENSRHVIKKRQWNGEDENSGAVADEVQLRNIESLFRRALEMNREAGRQKRQKNEENSPGISPTEVIMGKKNKLHGLKKKHLAVEHEEREEEDIPVVFKKRLASSSTERSGSKEHDVKRRQWNGEDEVEEHDEDESLPLNHNQSPFGVKRPVYSFVKTDREGNFKWSVRHASKR